MPNFRYKAVTEPGEIIEGDLEAPNQATVVEHLRKQGYFPLRAEEQVPRHLSSWFSREVAARRAVSRSNVAALLRELSMLLEAGLALDQALGVLIEFSDKPSVSELMKRVLERVRDGVALSEAMVSQGRVFDRFCVGMVRAGEASGALHVTLGKTAEHMERSEQSKREIKSALLYPSILLFSAIVSVVIIMTVVIPSFEEIFEQAGMKLPLITQVVLLIGEIAQRFWWLPLMLVLVAILVVSRQRRNTMGRLAWDRRLLKAPLLGALYAKAELTRVSFTLGMLLSNGVSLLPALAMAKETIGNSALASAIEATEAQVKEGRTLSGSLAETALFPKQAVHLLRIGEESGRLVEMLFRLADIYDQEVQTLIQRILTLLTPVLTLGLALLIAGIIVSILVPMLSVYQLAV